MVLRQEWHSAPLLEFTGHLIEEVLASWRRWGVLEKEKKKIQDHLTALKILKERGVKGSRIIGTNHAQRVVPLMRRALPLHMMAPGVALDRTTLTKGVLSPSKVAQRIKEAMEPLRDDAGAALNFVYPMPGHPLMWLEPGFIDFISSLSLCLLFS